MAEDYKRCPDCAEQVLAAARKCRYCGYRFGRTGARTGDSLADLVRTPPERKKTVPELLSQWGTPLAADESVVYFGHCWCDRRLGFLLVTNARVAFYAGRGDRRLLDWPRGEVSAFTQRRRLDGNQLRLSGPGGEVTLSRFASRRDFDEIAAALGLQNLEL
jgi:hypothetical protein